MTRQHYGPVILTIVLALNGCERPSSVAPGPAPEAIESPSTDAETAAVQDTTATSTTDSNVMGTDDSPPSDTASDISFREPDLRPRHAASRLTEHGIRVYESQRLRLYTDIEPEAAQTLPPLIDAVYDEWQQYFGPLPPARDGSDFQLSAYVMRDQDSFRNAGLLPVDLPVFSHGKHQGQEFWMNDQPHAYYRRHLLLHEATHCFMQSMGGTTVDVPLWYLEGMAELFATHTLDQDGRPTFRVIPARPDEFVGFGRIEMIRQDIEQERPQTFSQLDALSSRRFRRRQSAYAWSWAMCLLADRSPKYHNRFQELSRRYPSEGFSAAYETLFTPIIGGFEAEWTLLTREFTYGFDIERAMIDYERGAVPSGTRSDFRSKVYATQGWQSAFLEVVEGQTYRIEASGRVTLANDPKPWVSEPDGITIRYAEGHPIGQLLGVVIGDSDDSLVGKRTVSEVIPLGTESVFIAPASGTLYLRVNDFWSELADNQAAYSVIMRLTDE